MDSKRFSIMSVIVIGGNPGTGKTMIAAELSEKLGLPVVQLGTIAEENGCIREHDAARSSNVIDEDCLVEAIHDLLYETDKDFIIEGHYVDLVPSRKVKEIIILRTHPDILRERLLKRGYDKAKVNENVEAEVMGVCQMDAIFSFGEDAVYELDTTTMSVEECVTAIMEILGSKKKPEHIDWMDLLEEQGILDDYISI